MSAGTLVSRIDQLCASAGADTESAQVAASLEAIRRRLHSPLRIGVVGRVKAGKSTLLNAMIGERLAPTDAGECTRFVSTYHFAPQYEVKLRGLDNSLSALPFRKGDEALEVELPEEVDPQSRLEIGWPSRRLTEATLIDTPGLGSLDPSLRERGRSLFTDDGMASDVDAVLYLMRHAHREDIDFLEGFREAGVPLNSPVNTLAVLSRVDEIGSGRMDALDSASRIAARYQRDERIAALAGAVLPVAGLLAETAATMRESEYQALRQLTEAATDVESLLLSVDRFRDPERNPLAAEIRNDLLHRLGLFGIRFALEAVREGRAPSAQALSALLEQYSGIGPLRDMVLGRFTSRAQQLIARSALGKLRIVAKELRVAEPALARNLEAAIEEVMAGSHELAQLELAHRVAIGDIRFDDRERAEFNRLVGATSPAGSLGLHATAGPQTLKAAALAAVSRWRERGALPLTDRETRWAADVMTRSYEGIYAHVAGSSDST